MTIDYGRLMARDFPSVEHSYAEKDTILYGLTVGLGADPLDERQLRFVYEENLQVLPTMAAILAYPGLWIREPDTGLDWEHALHSEQGVDFLKTLPTTGVVKAKTRVTGIVDKGEGRGALIYTEREGIDAATDETLFRVRHTTFARNDGGFGGPEEPIRRPHPVPDRAPDMSVSLVTLPQQALLYRLNGDPNPHNVDPKAAAAAGLPRPIMHGLGTYGFVGHAILAGCCDYEPERLASLDLRFSAPVFPGETIVTEIWDDTGGVSFRAKAAERDRIVVNNGFAALR